MIPNIYSNNSIPDGDDNSHPFSPGYRGPEEKICRNCGGDGYITESGTEPQCCGNFTETGSCCNDPIAGQIPVQVQCERCNGVGYTR